VKGIKDKTLWIVVPIFVLILTNSILYQSHKQFLSDSQWGGETWAANIDIGELDEGVFIWSYVQTATFQGITAGLVFPIVLSLFESRFQYIQTKMEERRARKQKLEEERREKQWESVDEFTAIWSAILAKALQIVNIKQEKDVEQEKHVDVTSTIIETQKLFEKAHSLSNRIGFRFRKMNTKSNGIETTVGIKDTTRELIMFFIHHHLKLNLSVANYLKKYIDNIEQWNENDLEKIKNENQKIQKSLLVCVRATYDYVFPRSLDILKYHIELADVAGLGDTQKEIDKIKLKIDTTVEEFELLRKETASFNYYESILFDSLTDEEEFKDQKFTDNDKLTVKLTYDEVKERLETYREKALEYENWLKAQKKDKGEMPLPSTDFHNKDYTSSKQLRESFNAIPFEVYTENNQLIYSRDYINGFARCYGEDLLRVDIHERANAPQLIKEEYDSYCKEKRLSKQFNPKDK